MCFVRFLKVGEVVAPNDTGFASSPHLSYADVRVNNVTDPQYQQVRLKASKTDPFRREVLVYLGKGTPELCPVAVTLSFQGGRSLTSDCSVGAVQTALDAAGINSSHYVGHSFCIGMATSAAQQGIQDSLIKTLGR